MTSHQTRDALSQVRDLQHLVLAKQKFKGYSGRARMLGGTLALLTAAVMSSAAFPQTITYHLYGWGLVFATGLLIFYGTLLHWLFSQRNDKIRLYPILDAFPALFVGGVFTLLMIRIDQVDLLFGIWMCLFGLTCLATRHTLPRSYWMVGIFYITCGTGYLLSPTPSFLNPWPMGLVFFIGELWGGAIFYFNNQKHTHQETLHYGQK
jgi:hypothetical protein